MISNTIELELRNEALRTMFDGFRDEFFKIRDEHGVDDGVSVNMQDGYSGEYYCEEEYLMMIQEEGHEGFPDKYNSINIPQLAREKPEVWREYLDRVKNRTAEYIGAHTSALSLFYPSGGFVGWHTNHNCSSYQLLFTWSENGDGFFRYQDPKTKEIVTLQDKPGWNVRAHYFGNEKEQDHMLWHSAYTNCDRFSFAYKWVNDGLGSDRDEICREMFEEAILEVETR